MFKKPGRISLTVLAAVIICAFLVSGLLSYKTAKNSLRNEIKNSSLPLLSENIYSELHKSLSTPINVSSSMSRDSFLINWVNSGEKDQFAIELYLRNLKDRYGFFSTFFVSDQTKNYYYYDGILKQISPMDKHDVWYYDFYDSGKEADLDVDTDEASNGILTIFINYRLEGFSGNFIGVVGVGVKLEQIAESLREKKAKYNRNVYLVDENGYIQVHSNIDLIEKRNIYTQEGIKQVAEDLMTLSEIPIDRTYKLKSETILVSSRYIPELGWHVIVEQGEKETFSQARKSLYINLLLTVVIAGVLFTVSYRILKGFESQMETIAGTDSLTGIANRRDLTKRFDLYRYRAERYNFRLSLFLIDLDNFKFINDEYGHMTGDDVLKSVSQLITGAIRPTDLVARWGGDEFVIIMEAPISEAEKTGERILKKCGDLQQGKICEILTISIGITEFRSEDTLNSLVNRADKALYISKQKGKNQLSVL